MAFDEEGNGESSDDDSSEELELAPTQPRVELPKLPEEADEDPYLQGATIDIIYEAAVAAIPDDLEFRLQFVEIFSHFRNTQNSRDKVYST